MIIAIDFDGTCVTHEFPKTGKDIGAVPVLQELVKNGHKLILFTMRSDIESPKSDDPEIVYLGGKYLTAAVLWFLENGIELWGINSNPEQHTWTKSPKVYANLYIDDAALGAPLKSDPKLSERMFIDWPWIRITLVEMGIIKGGKILSCNNCGWEGLEDEVIISFGNETRNDREVCPECQGETLFLKE